MVAVVVTFGLMFLLLEFRSHLHTDVNHLGHLLRVFDNTGWQRWSSPSVFKPVNEVTHWWFVHNSSTLRSSATGTLSLI